MSDTDQGEAAVHRAAFARVLELAVLVGEDMDRELGRVGLTRSRAHLLWILRRGGPCTQRALADALGVSARNVTGLVDGLEATGFVERAPHPSDRRAALVTLTSHGAAAAQTLERDEAELAHHLFSPMAPGELGAVVAGLAAVIERFRERQAKAAGVTGPRPGRLTGL